jgi:hypothetical protein
MQAHERMVNNKRSSARTPDALEQQALDKPTFGQLT